VFSHVHLSFSVHVFRFPSVTVCVMADTSCGITRNVAFIEEAVKKRGKGGGGCGAILHRNLRGNFVTKSQKEVNKRTNRYKRKST
jgi:hypothetical protein